MSVTETVKGVLGLETRDERVQNYITLMSAPPIRKSVREQREEVEAADDRLLARLRAERESEAQQLETKLRDDPPRALIEFRNWLRNVEQTHLWVAIKDRSGAPVIWRRSPVYESSFTQRPPRADFAPLPPRDESGRDSDVVWLKEMIHLLYGEKPLPGEGRPRRPGAFEESEGRMVFMASAELAAAIREWRVRIEAHLASPQMQPLDEATRKLIAPARERL